MNPFQTIKRIFSDDKPCCRTCKFFKKFEMRPFNKEYQGLCSIKHNSPEKEKHSCEQYEFGDEEGKRILEKSW